MKRFIQVKYEIFLFLALLPSVVNPQPSVFCLHIQDVGGGGTRVKSKM